MTVPLFLIPILAGLVAQALKPIFNRDQRDEQARTLDPRPKYGGMPSAHAAFGSALVFVAAIKEGPASAVFAVALAIFILIVDDALRLRVFLGRYGLSLHRLLQRLPLRERRQLPPVESRLGHTLPEVAGGVVVGVVVTFAILVLEELL